MVWFLYDNGLRDERVEHTIHLNLPALKLFFLLWSSASWYLRSIKCATSINRSCLYVLYFVLKLFTHQSILDTRNKQKMKVKLIFQCGSFSHSEFLQNIFFKTLKWCFSSGWNFSVRPKFFQCDALHDLVPTLLKVSLLWGCFSRFLNCTNVTKSPQTSHIMNV